MAPLDVLEPHQPCEANCDDVVAGPAPDLKEVQRLLRIGRVLRKHLANVDDTIALRNTIAGRARQ